MSNIYASIREDLYLSDKRIIATEVATQKKRYLDPILWQVVAVLGSEVLLERPQIAGGGLFNFESIDLDFETL